MIFFDAIFVSVLLKGVGRLGQDSLCEEEQNPQRRFQVSVHLDEAQTQCTVFVSF